MGYWSLVSYWIDWVFEYLLYCIRYTICVNFWITYSINLALLCKHNLIKFYSTVAAALFFQQRQSFSMTLELISAWILEQDDRQFFWWQRFDCIIRLSVIITDCNNQPFFEATFISLYNILIKKVVFLLSAHITYTAVLLSHQLRYDVEFGDTLFCKISAFSINFVKWVENCP